MISTRCNTAHIHFDAQYNVAFSKVKDATWIINNTCAMGHVDSMNLQC